MSDDDAIVRIEGDRIIPSAYAAGPWDPNAQHGSVPTSVITHIVEHMPAPGPMQIARLTIDLMRPVPLAPLQVKTETLREGRKIQVIGVSLTSEGKECVRATVLRTRVAPADLPEAAQPAPFLSRLPLDCPIVPENPQWAGFVKSLELRVVSGGGPMAAAGPTACWFKLKRPMVEGASMSPFMRAAVAADFPNGLSSQIKITEWLFINGDLTVNYFREPVGEWILCDAQTSYGPNGAAIAVANLADEKGWIGRSIQSLVVERR
ncbi:MAG: thioesterase family protein [Alphaproteobacteria bacterium]|nr:thioesterase family protein [Alphaproteobacteria bacterium]